MTKDVIDVINDLKERLTVFLAQTCNQTVPGSTRKYTVINFGFITEHIFSGITSEDGRKRRPQYPIL